MEFYYKSTIFLFISYILIVLSLTSVSTSNLEGFGVCYENKTVESTIPVSKWGGYVDSDNYHCLDFPTWCLEHGEKETADNQTQILSNFIIIKYCCPGYEPTEDRGKCKPICSSLCKTGFCSSPDNCTNCTSGYSGRECDPVCSSHCLEGSCESAFMCLQCEAGYSGVACDPVCSKYCEDEGCIKPNTCTKCKPGFVGTDCKPRCPENYYSENCSLVCNCLNDRYYCNSNFGCVCSDEYSGLNCELEAATSTTSLFMSLWSAVLAILILIIVGLSLLIYTFIKQRGQKYTITDDERTPILQQHPPSSFQPLAI